MTTSTTTTKQTASSENAKAQPSGSGQIGLEASLAPASQKLRRPNSYTPAEVLWLQRSVGNRAVQRLLGRQPPLTPISEKRAGAGLVVQPKLTVGPAKDRYEAEADGVADRVMRSIKRSAHGQPIQRQSKQLQRMSGPAKDRYEAEADGVADRVMRSIKRSAHGQPIQRQSKQLQRMSGPATVQRLIKTKLPTRWYRRSGNSASSRVNLQIDMYNANVKSGTTTPKHNADHLLMILEMLKSVDTQKKAAQVSSLKAEIREEQRKIEAVGDVMELARKRARLQESSPKVETGSREESEKMRALEVIHATNPLSGIGGGKSVGDSLSETGELRNIHQVKKSMIGSDSDGDKRKNAEMGLFYPQRYRRGSFSRSAFKNKSETQGIQKGMLPPLSVLPKYAALNLAGSEYGALGELFGKEVAPLHFVMNQKTLEERTTVTSGDSLRQWSPIDSDFGELQDHGMIPKGSLGKDALPEDESPWNTGGVATYDSEHSNFGQVVSTGSAKTMRDGGVEENPDRYVEAQVHGELMIDRDIDHVKANFAKLFGNPRFASLYASFKSSKKPIKWYYWREKVKEGNLVSQNWERGEESYFETAWKAAAVVWNTAQKQSFKKFQKSGRKNWERDYENEVKLGAISKEGAAKLYKIWEDLK